MKIDMTKQHPKYNDAVPIPIGKEFLANRWGIRKRKRYAELLKEGIDRNIAFDCVEIYKDILQEKEK